MARGRFELITVVPAPPERVWERVTTPEGINHEMGPWLRMTMPRALRDATIDDVPVGERAGRSWLLLGRVLPVDYDDLQLVELERGRRFLERSAMGSMRVWQHERIVDRWPAGGSTVTDRIEFVPRALVGAIPGSSRLAERIVAAFFRHRHRRLVSHFSD